MHSQQNYLRDSGKQLQEDIYSLRMTPCIMFIQMLMQRSKDDLISRIVESPVTLSMHFINDTQLTDHTGYHGMDGQKLICSEVDFPLGLTYY